MSELAQSAGTNESPQPVFPRGWQRKADRERTVSQKLLFDYTGVVAIVGIAVSWGVFSNRLDVTAKEIEILRAESRGRVEASEKNAAAMARMEESLRNLSVALADMRQDLRNRPR